MNPGIVDLSDPDELVKTVEDPNPRINADIARWINAGDLELSGINVTEALAHVDHPLLLVIANKDGIVPSDTALSAREAWGGTVETLHVGDEETWYAHADLFIGDPAPGAVFEPISAFLMKSGDYPA
jgi:pimeloyl-ACP methyl ester carboxylesterase